MITAATSSQDASVALRVWNAWRRRGSRYVVHKLLRRAPIDSTNVKRRLLYENPRDYWTLRGGDDYFLEQEHHPSRTLRSEWLADRIARYRPTSVLEVGCGYGKQLKAIRSRLPDARLVGVDFSPTQLARGREYLAGHPDIAIGLASGATLPFADAAFDLVLTSAVILHNPPPLAERMRLEVLRVARRLAAHNEDTDVSYNRYGYDTAAWYRSRGVPLAEVGPIDVPEDPDRLVSQFCVAESWRR